MTGLWDIFCRVIDNYGDLGVCWRLARQLAARGFPVRLWVDDWALVEQLIPGTYGCAAPLHLDGVQLQHWQGAPQVEPGAVVIEAFGCDLDAAFVAAMRCADPQPVWINLEYLSAESWVDECHGLPSLQQGGLRKYFFFPGFSLASGGLLREPRLLDRCIAWQAQAQAQCEWLQSLGVPCLPGEQRISLFAYENAALADWLDTLAQSAHLTRLLVPQSRVCQSLADWLGEPVKPGHYLRGALHIHVLPFLESADYDRLLWSCDLNCVRGEDSLVRALWAGRPLLWHIYPQADGAHWVKLEAFLQRYLEGVSAPAATAMRALHMAWNEGSGMLAAWRDWRAVRGEVLQAAQAFRAGQAQWPDLVSRLVEFAAKPV